MFDAKKGASILTSKERNRRGMLKEEFGKGALMEEISWRQKFRAIWLKEEDKIIPSFFLA